MHPDTRHGHNKAQNRAERVANTATLQQQDNALAELTECTFVHILHVPRTMGTPRNTIDLHLNRGLSKHEIRFDHQQLSPEEGQGLARWVQRLSSIGH